MKIIFLDIDGVLNHQQYFEERYDARKQDKLIKEKDGKFVTKSDIDFYAEEIDPKSVENLNELIKETWAYGGHETYYYSFDTALLYDEEKFEKYAKELCKKNKKDLLAKKERNRVNRLF